MTTDKAIFLIGFVACVLPWTPPWAALLLGILLALIFGNPFPKQSKNASKILLQACVVLLGFGMDLNTVLTAGSQGVLFAFGSITCVFLLGWLLQRGLKLRPVAGLLVSTGTAICGGSAIAAMSTVMDADQEDVSVAVGTVFILNAIALIMFPPLGHYFGLSQHQFGTWAGIAIHDVASVVGAGKQYGPEALDVGTAVKLSRVLYLIPITIIAAWWVSRTARKDADTKGASAFPWFILGFVAASLIRTYIPVIAGEAATIKLVASIGLACALYLIGSGITRSTLQKVGIKPLVQGVVLWAFISIAAFFVVRSST
ncbi:MAG: putative sulfate exporter family transporter [Armatimonadota bacterium]|nr:putative sulfate exporter family transporter [Armatimonadota bacterium]